MSVDAWKSIFDMGTVLAAFLVFVFGAGALITGNIINKRQESQLRQFDKGLTEAKTELSKQQERAANADARVAGLEHDTADAKKEMAKQQERAATAELKLLELQERIRPRKLTTKQEADFVTALRALPGGTIDFGYTSGGGDESFNFAKQFLPLFKSASWNVQNEASIANHLDIQVIGVGVLNRGAAAPNPNLPVSGVNVPPPGFITLTPTLAAIQSAFRAVGIEVQFINYPVDRPEVVIGSKP